MAHLPLESDELFVPIDAESTGSLGDVGLSAPRFFPSPLVSTTDGLVCVGGRLTPEWLLDAYRHGIFPWPVWDDEPMAWWSLDPRAIFEFEVLHVSRRLRRTIRSGKFTVTCDRDFAGVIRGCATAGDRQEGTWLTPSMIAAYSRTAPAGPRPQHRGLARKRTRRRHLRRRDRRAVCGREHVLSRARCVQGRRSYTCSPTLKARGYRLSTFSNGRPTPAGSVRS